MQHYSIQQVSELLIMPKDTLRYYDKLGLVCPTRGENRYRYYTDSDIIDLQYLETLKYAQFTLAEIRQFFIFRRGQGNENEHEEIMQLFADKKQEFQQKIKTYRTMISLIDQTMELKAEHSTNGGMDKVNTMVKETFKNIKEGHL